MEMYLQYELLARVKQHDYERQLAQDAPLREVRGGAGARRGVRRRLAVALLVLADRLDPALPTGSAGMAHSPVRLG